MCVWLLCCVFVCADGIADLESAVLEMFAGLETDERLAGQGLAEAFAEAFPNLPDA